MFRPDLRPPIVGQAERADSLWGAKEDSRTGDGIAESRRAELQLLVERFAPTLVLPRNDAAMVNGNRFWMIPTNASLYADTLKLDMIRAAPYVPEDTFNISLHSPATSTDSLARLVESTSLYYSDPDLLVTAYFDFPGRNPREWWQAYGRLRTGPDSARWATPTVYAHPFIEARGLLAIQYWFFYPFNDFVGNHEGDWEHITVVASADHERIHEVHYYFHQRSLTVPQDGFAPDTVDGTHPVVFVGGRMYHLPDYPIRLFAKEHNEGSHGSFPYPGEWEGVAGLGAPEHVRGIDQDSLRVVSYRQFEVKLTPEPERIEYHRQPDVLREWGWLLLPVRWGFPVSRSVGSELGVDVGNRGPFGPAFNAAWNRTSPGMSYPGYRLRRIPKLQSYIEDLLQPWYWPYAFRTPRFIHDTRDTMPHRMLEEMGLVPRSGWGERGFGTTAMGLSLAYPEGELADEFDAGKGFSLWRSLWATMRIGKLEVGAGYQRFPRNAESNGLLYVYPLTLGFVSMGPGARFRPYLGGGVGAYGWQTRTPSGENRGYHGASGWSWGLHAKAGIEYYMRPTVALDLGVRLHRTHLDAAAAGLASDHLQFMQVWVGHYLRF